MDNCATCPVKGRRSGVKNINSAYLYIRGEREACSCMLQTPNPEWEICLEQICFNTAEKRRGSIADVKKEFFYVSPVCHIINPIVRKQHPPFLCSPQNPEFLWSSFCTNSPGYDTLCMWGRPRTFPWSFMSFIGLHVRNWLFWMLYIWQGSSN